MPDTGELATILARTDTMRWIHQHATSHGCDIAVFGADGAPLAGDESVTTVTVSSDDETVSVEGTDRPSAIRKLETYDRDFGFVVAVARDADHAAPESIAEAAASVLQDLVSREFELNDMSREILSAYEELNLFYDLAGELSGAPDATAICAAVLGRAMHVTRARAGRIVLRDGSDLYTVAARGEDSDKVDVPDVGLASRVIAMRQAALIEGGGQLRAIGRDDWETEAVVALIAVPVYVPSEFERPAIGALELRDRQTEAGGLGNPFRSGDLKLAQALASQAAVLIENSRLIGFERELRIARGIQESLLPARMPDVFGFDVAGRCLAASNVGGDYYDLVVRADGSLEVVLADVSGHHLAAALIQTAARSTFRAALLDHRSPADILAHVNAVLSDDLTRAELFLTAWYGHADGESGRVLYSDAGHHPALVYRVRTRQVEPLRMGGLPIGVSEDGMYRDHEVHLEPGDVLVAYTDGLSEAHGPGGAEDLFGDARVASAVTEAAAGGADEIVRSVLAAVAAFDRGGDRDDRTIVVLKRRTPMTR